MRCLIFVCLLLGCAPGFALDRNQVEGYLLPNGLQVLLKPGYERDHVSIRLVVGIGFDDFPCAQKELPHLLEHLLFSGIDDDGEGGLEKRMQALGGEWNAYTSSADTTFVIEAPARNQRKVLDLLLAIIQQTRIDDDALALSKRIVEREDGGHYTHLQRWLDRQDLGQRSSDQLAVELGLKCAERSDVEDMTVEQVEEVRKRWYASNNMTLIVVGGLDRVLPAYLERSYGELEPVEPVERRTLAGVTRQAEAERTLIHGVLGNSTRLSWLFLEPVLDSEHDETLELLQRYLDWALYDELRLRHGLSYGPWSQRETFGDSGLLSLNADLERDQVAQAEAVVRDLLERLREDGLDPRTFERVKAAAIAREAWTTQGNSALADYYWGALNGYADGRFVDPAQRMRGVSLDEANQAMRLLFKAPGWVRVEKPLLGYDELFWAGVLGVLLVVVGGGIWYRRRSTI
ncbi:pitrilysin family protein [Pseudomonas sp. zfem002]|uniref:M16 family metallopeptidase n=1 Tax=Pseudomonas sp. zfem002 TaxID=3078197 RepID=UPI0029279408|nr:pitrilysin family protein [Pseudomonas sp. zfem002]MDU9393450.1 pitrilysin family protein [Pseudomonas sp. zfem002]